MGMAAQQARLMLLSMRTKLVESAKQIAGKLNGKDDLFDNNSKDIGGDSFTSSSKQENSLSANDIQAELIKRQKELKNFF